MIDTIFKKWRRKRFLKKRLKRRDEMMNSLFRAYNMNSVVIDTDPQKKESYQRLYKEYLEEMDKIIIELREMGVMVEENEERWWGAR